MANAIEHSLTEYIEGGCAIWTLATEIRQPIRFTDRVFGVLVVDNGNCVHVYGVYRGNVLHGSKRLTGYDAELRISEILEAQPRYPIDVVTGRCDTELSRRTADLVNGKDRLLHIGAFFEGLAGFEVRVLLMSLSLAGVILAVVTAIGIMDKSVSWHTQHWSLVFGIPVLVTYLLDNLLTGALEWVFCGPAMSAVAQGSGVAGNSLEYLALNGEGGLFTLGRRLRASKGLPRHIRALAFVSLASFAFSAAWFFTGIEETIYLGHGHGVERSNLVVCGQNGCGASSQAKFRTKWTVQDAYYSVATVEALEWLNRTTGDITRSRLVVPRATSNNTGWESVGKSGNLGVWVSHVQCDITNRTSNDFNSTGEWYKQMLRPWTDLAERDIADGLLAVNVTEIFSNNRTHENFMRGFLLVTKAVPAGSPKAFEEGVGFWCTTQVLPGEVQEYNAGGLVAGLVEMEPEDTSGPYPAVGDYCIGVSSNFEGMVEITACQGLVVGEVPPSCAPSTDSDGILKGFQGWMMFRQVVGLRIRNAEYPSRVQIDGVRSLTRGWRFRIRPAAIGITWTIYGLALFGFVVAACYSGNTLLRAVAQPGTSWLCRTAISSSSQYVNRDCASVDGGVFTNKFGSIGVDGGIEPGSIGHLSFASTHESVGPASTIRPLLRSRNGK